MEESQTTRMAETGQGKGCKGSENEVYVMHMVKSNED